MEVVGTSVYRLLVSYPCFLACRFFLEAASQCSHVIALRHLSFGYEIGSYIYTAGFEQGTRETWHGLQEGWRYVSE
jgi:hypothetical protein